MTTKLRRLRVATLVTIVAMMLLLAGAAAGDPGDLDPTFNGTGVALLDHGAEADFGAAVVVQPDGKIIAGGTSVDSANNDFLLARFETNGSPDLDFGTGGVATTTFGNSQDDLQGLALQDDGKIVAVGNSVFFENQLAVVRLNVDGSPDPTFNEPGPVDGWVLIGPGTFTSGRDVAVAQDGSIIAVGTTSAGGPGTFSVVKLSSSGAPDLTFDTETVGGDEDDDGVVQTDIGDGNDEAHALALQPDGKIVAAGLSQDGGVYHLGLARYESGGDPDDSFSGDGKLLTPPEADTELVFGAVDVAVQPDGKILVATGTEDLDGDGDLTLFRYGTDGTLDDSFGGDGRLGVELAGDELPAAIALTNDGRMIIAGSIDNGTDNDLMVARLLGNGALDPSFGAGGSVVTPVGSQNDFAGGVAIQPDGKLAVVGSSVQEGPEAEFWDQMLTARYAARSAVPTTIDSSTATPVFGRSFTLSGQLTSADPLCRGGVEVQISRDVLGGSVAFAPIASRTTANDGTFSLGRTADRSANYRASVPASDSCEAGLDSQTVKVKKKVSLQASDSRVPAGSTVRLKATVAPCAGHRGDPVILQRKTASGFKKVASKASNQKCVAVFRVTMNGTRVFRAVAPKTDPDHLAGQSRTRRVTTV